MKSSIPPPIAQSESSETSTINTYRRNDQSQLSSLVQTVIKLFSRIILHSSITHEAGSPQLTPHHSATKLCRIHEHRFADTFVYAFSPLSPTRETQAPGRTRLYYFAGGGFRDVALKEHWRLCAELSKQLPEYEINLVSYPLAPNSPASHSLPHLRRFYDTCVLQAAKDGCRVTLMGDSAGGNIAAVLGVYGATQWLSRTKSNNIDSCGGTGICPLRNLLLMSPATDMRNINPEIDIAEMHDPILSRKIITEVADRWRGEFMACDSQVSPLLADLTVFQRAGVRVNGLVGLYDVLAPDAIEFRKALEEYNVQGEWMEWDKQMHCFPLMFFYHVREAVVGKDWIVDVLRKDLKD